MEKIGGAIWYLFGPFSMTFASALIIFVVSARKKHQLTWLDLAAGYSSAVIWFIMTYFRPHKSMVNMETELLWLGFFNACIIVISYLISKMLPISRIALIFILCWSVAVLLQLLFPFLTFS